MMSVVVSDSDGKLFVFSKGAETAILPLVADKEASTFTNTIEHIERFAEQGMRTLVFAFKQIDRVENIEEQDECSRSFVEGKDEF